MVKYTGCYFSWEWAKLKQFGAFCEILTWESMEKSESVQYLENDRRVKQMKM